MPTAYGIPPYGTASSVPVVAATPAGTMPAVPIAPAYAVPMVMAPVFVGPQKSKATAALLCFFLGWLGIHRFYTGQTGIGLAQLLLNLFLFWTIVVPLAVGVWVLIDFILILTGGVKDNYGRPLA